MQGGGPGARGRNVLIRDGVEELLPGKIELRLRPGDRLRIETPGGGGYGKVPTAKLTKGTKDSS